MNLFDTWSPFVLGFHTFLPRAGHDGDFIPGSFDAGGRTMRYRLFVPSGHAGQPMPLVVMLHGCGQDAADFALGTGMNGLAEECRALVLYPEQSAAAHWNRCWNWYDPTHHRRGEGEPAAIAALTRHVAAEYAVDGARIAVAGLSSGASMAVILGQTYPDLFKAVGCHSGLAHGSATDGVGAMLAMRDGAPAAMPACGAAPDAVPVIVFHGDADATVHQHNGAGVVRQSIDRHAVGTVEEQGECRGRAFTRHVHLGGDGAVLAEQWTVHGAGHAWSGGNPQGSFTDGRGPEASREMLRFFLQR
ncbi:MAG: extracellular catalytic domain type 1 short-chain-length polyhydroxyalkanoate depolymerase [Ramlibacter sp.]